MLCCCLCCLNLCCVVFVHLFALPLLRSPPATTAPPSIALSPTLHWCDRFLSNTFSAFENQEFAGNLANKLCHFPRWVCHAATCACQVALLHINPVAGIHNVFCCIGIVCNLIHHHSANEVTSHNQSGG